MPRPQMPKPLNPNTTANVPGTDFTQAQRRNVSQARSEANAAKPVARRIERLLKPK